MLAGKRLFDGETISDTLAAVLKSEPDWDRVPGKARRLLRSCLEKDPKHRLRDIGDAWRLLEEAPPAVVTAPPERSWLPWALTSLTLAAALALGWVAYRHSTEEVRTLRFHIQPPEKTTFNLEIPAVSPDGRRVAYVADDGRGGTALWVHELDSVEARRLASNRRGQPSVLVAGQPQDWLLRRWKVEED